MSSGLHSAVEALYGLERRRSDFRVEDTARVLAALGNPQLRFRSVHVAGTNGKGSVAAWVERVLRAAHQRMGLYTSPHLVDYRERIRIDGRWPETLELEQRLETIRGIESARGRTFFEITTALGFDAFARHDVEWAVVEVGLGGRLDATNVLMPEVCAITSVGLDHTEILGTTLAEVAREKAGIIKPGIPVIAGSLPPEAASEARAIAAARGAPWIEAGSRVGIANAVLNEQGARFSAECAPWGTLEIAMSLRGAHQVGNARVALAVLSVLTEAGLAISAEAVREGFAAARWPGRLEPCPAQPRLWWDGAHNLEGVEHLVSAWRADLALPPPGAIVFAASRDKPVADMLGRLHDFAPGALLFTVRTRNERALPAGQLAAHALVLGWQAEAREDVGAATAEALSATAGRVLLLGSLFAVGEAMQSLGGAPEGCS